MLAAVEFDHQAGPITKKVCDIGTNGNLPPELKSVELLGA